MLLAFASISCRRESPSITFTQVPGGSTGGPESKGVLAGRVTGYKPGQRMVLYARSGNRWWIQPYARAPYTEIKPDGTWSAEIHLGMTYAAALVTGNELQKAVPSDLPKVDESVLAVATVQGVQAHFPEGIAKHLRFAGYEWEVKAGSGGYGGKSHHYAPENVWVDEHGAMHLRVTRVGNLWVCGEAHVARTLGYGSYRWRLRDVGHLEPAAMMSMFTWSTATDQQHREIDLHISRWGDPISKNAEYVIQPYYMPANVYRLDLPAGPVEESFRWTPGRVEFASSTGKGKSKPADAWTFTSGVPISSDENASVNLCEFGYSKLPLQHETEVVIEQFEFLP